MHITIVYQYFGTYKGSWSTRIYDFAQAWIKLGNTVTVITSPYYKSDIKTKGFYTKMEIDGIDVRILKFSDNNKHSVLRRAVSSILFAATSSVMSLFHKTDVIIASSGPITVGLTILMNKVFRSKVKRIFEVRDLWPEGARQMKLISDFQVEIGRIFERKIYESSDLIVTCSDGMNHFIRSSQKDREILTIPNVAQEKRIAISLKSEYEYPCWAESSKILLYAGSIGKMDAVEDIVDAFVSATDLSKNIHLVIIGDGELVNDLKRIAHQSSRTSQIHFLGLLPKNDIYHWYNIADFSLVVFKPLPVLSTSSPNKLFDSIAMGVPVINNTRGWIKDLLDSYKAGINYTGVSELIGIFRDIDKELIQARDFDLSDLKSEFEHERIASKYLEKIRSLK